MKLVEVKNNLAKLYYIPSETPLAISDFLTVDDGNQKILSQVISIEATSKEDTNCAILKFSLNINDDNTHENYSGYVPPMDAVVYKTDNHILEKIFSGASQYITLGNLANSSGIELKSGLSLLDNFLYIQSDTHEDTTNIFKKIVECNNRYLKKSLILDYDNTITYSGANIIQLGNEFKLPVGNEILNYIYENDLTGLTIEQKTIVQDIILEIQDYISTLESGYIPFNTLLDVVNSVYETDKSVGVILLRNKLLKYKQYGIFASSDNEINALDNALNSNTITVLNLAKINSNWQKETINFILNNIQTDIYLISVLDEENTDKDLLQKIHTTSNIKPVLCSSYDFALSQQVKSFAKNLILFKPLEQQRAFATYNSFLMKLNEGEFIVSGEVTYFTPLIIKNLPEHIVLSEISLVPAAEQEDQTEVEDQDSDVDVAISENVDLDDLVENNDEQLQDFELLEPDEELAPLEEIDLQESNQSEIKTIFDESLENEIAKDVDEMLYTNSQQNENTNLTEYNTENDLIEEEQQQYKSDERLSEDDLELFDDNQVQDTQDLLAEESIQPADGQQMSTNSLSESQDLPTLDDLDNLEDLSDLSDADDLPLLPDVDDDILGSNPEQNIQSKQTDSNIPVYNTEPDNTNNDSSSIKISEGNIVYHEKYGRGVVEELFNYGKRTLCSIQFDNVGRRLLDPNLAELKQM